MVVGKIGLGREEMVDLVERRKRRLRSVSEGGQRAVVEKQSLYLTAKEVDMEEVPLEL